MARQSSAVMRRRASSVPSSGSGRGEIRHLKATGISGLLLMPVISPVERSSVPSGLMAVMWSCSTSFCWLTNMHFFGEHTFSFYNEKNERVWVKFHFRTQQGIKNLSDEEAARICASDRESSGRDLYEAIERGDYPRWTMYVQIMRLLPVDSYFEGRSDAMSETVKNQILSQLGLLDPWYTQLYHFWTKLIFHGDLGNSIVIRKNVPCVKIIWPKAVTSFKFGIISLVFQQVLGLAMGVGMANQEELAKYRAKLAQKAAQ